MRALVSSQPPTSLLQGVQGGAGDLGDRQALRPPIHSQQQGPTASRHAGAAVMAPAWPMASALKKLPTLSPQEAAPRRLTLR
jgi:hypothetical protein